jgi:hypothetical protein
VIQAIRTTVTISIHNCKDTSDGTYIFLFLTEFCLLQLLIYRYELEHDRYLRDTVSQKSMLHVLLGTYFQFYYFSIFSFVLFLFHSPSLPFLTFPIAH